MSDHITTRPATGTWSVRAGGAVIGESKNAIELIEGDLPPVIYFPKSDLAMAFLDQTDQTSICPIKAVQPIIPSSQNPKPLPIWGGAMKRRLLGWKRSQDISRFTHRTKWRLNRFN